MVAYARDERAIASHLVPAMASRAHLNLQGVLAVLSGEGCDSGEFHEALHTSTHTRRFEWNGERGPACPITIYHSWHHCGSRVASVVLPATPE